jgi:hypothetical protein
MHTYAIAVDVPLDGRIKKDIYCRAKLIAGCTATEGNRVDLDSEGRCCQSQTEPSLRRLLPACAQSPQEQAPPSGKSRTERRRELANSPRFELGTYKEGFLPQFCAGPEWQGADSLIWDTVVAWLGKAMEPISGLCRPRNSRVLGTLNLYRCRSDVPAAGSLKDCKETRPCIG